MLRISQRLSDNSTNLVSSSADKPSNDISSIYDQKNEKLWTKREIGRKTTDAVRLTWDIHPGAPELKYLSSSKAPETFRVRKAIFS